MIPNQHNQNNKSPIIGILPDYKENEQNSYSTKSFYAIRTSFIEAIVNAGGLPLILPYYYQKIDQYLEMIDGLMIIGGYFDIHPNRYSNESLHPKTKLNMVRSDYEFAFASKALNHNNMPILGICNGMQLLSVMHNGKLIQHIPDEKNSKNINFINHEQSHTKGFEDYSTPYHDVEIVENSQLFSIIGKKTIKTNSSHHQGVRSVGNQLKVVAYASDGMIEAVEKPDHPFCIGVQWHPELFPAETDPKIFSAFIAHSQKYSSNKK